MKIQVLYLDKLRFKSEKILADTFLERIQGSAKKLIDPIITKQITIKEMDQEFGSLQNLMIDGQIHNLNGMVNGKKMVYFI